MFKSIIAGLITFVIICMMGMFCMWIGGAEPFTGATGMGFVMTFLIATVCAFGVAAASEDTEEKRRYRRL